MKNQIKLTKKFSSVVVVVMVFAVTFFIAAAVSLAQTTSYQGPPANPPEGNPPGFIFNNSGQKQEAQVNISGPAKIETSLIVAEGTSNEIIVGQGAVRTPQVCLPPYDAANCVSSWDGIIDQNTNSFWEQRGNYIYSTIGAVPVGRQPYDLALRLYDSGKGHFEFLNDWLEFNAVYSTASGESGNGGTGEGDALIIAWGDDANDELRFVNNINVSGDQTVMTLKRTGVNVQGNFTATGTICDGSNNCLGSGGGEVFLPAADNSASYYGRMNVTGSNSIGIKLSMDKRLDTLSDSNTFAITNGELALNRLSARGTIDAHTDLCLTSTGISECGLTATQLQTAGMPNPMTTLRPFRSSGVPQFLIDEGPDKISRIELLGENASGIIANVGPNSRFSNINNKFGFIVANATYPGGQGIWINTNNDNKFGFVGIGTTNPQARLDVSGTTFFRSNPTTGGGQVEIEAYYNEDVAFPSSTELNNPNRSNYGGVFAGGIRVNEYYDASTDVMRKTRQGPSGTFEMKEWGDWMFTVSPNGTQGSNANTNRKTPLTLKNDGRVGIRTTGGNWNDGTSMIDASLTVYKPGGGGAIDIYGDSSALYDYAGIRIWGTQPKFVSGSSSWNLWHRSGNSDSGATRNDFQINENTGVCSGTSCTHIVALHIKHLTGNVGIKTETPQADLTVKGQILATGDSARMTLGNGPSNPLTSDVWVMDNYYYPSNSTYNKLFRIYRQNNLTTAQGGWQTFLMMATNGNLGIGIVPTTASGYKLHVGGNIKATGTICDGSGNCIGAAGSNTWNTSGNNIYNANTGNVGIGTSAPMAEFHVYSGANSGEKTYFNSSSYDGLLVNSYWNTASANYGVVDFVAGRYTNSSSGGSKFRFFTQPRTGSTGAVPPELRMEIDKDGSVGIGAATHPVIRLRTAISGQSSQAVVGINNTQDSVAGVGGSVWGSLAQNVGGTSGYGVGVFGSSATPNGIGVQGSVTNSTGYSGYFTGGRGMYVDKLCFANGECKTSWSGGIVSACTPDCSGKVCGDDGCGGSCGTCSGTDQCSVLGQCVVSDPKSDLRLKDVQGKYQYGLDEILALNPIFYRFKSGNLYNLSTEQRVGLIAQDVEPIIPEAITRDENGYLGLNEESIIYAMLNAIKEQQEQIVKLQVQIEELRINQ